MPEETSSQSMNFSGGQFSKVQIGQANRDLSQAQEISQNESGKQLTPTDVVKLLEQIETVFQNSDLPINQKEKAAKHLESAREETIESEPDKDFVLKNVQRASKILKDGNEATNSAQEIWRKLEPIAKQLAPWFGVTVKTLLGM